MDWKALFLSANGRIGRQQFWIGWLILFAANFVSQFIPFLGLLIMLFLIYCQVCVTSKRLHDMGKSGWLQLVPIGVFFVLMVIGLVMSGGAIMQAAQGMNPNDPGALMALIGSAAALMGMFLLGLLVSLAFLIWIGVTPSQKGPNAYGAEPGTPGTVETFN